MIPSEREDTECSCETCKNMCRRQPCVGTPEEVRKLLEKFGPSFLQAQIFIDPENMKGPYLHIGLRTKENGSCKFLIGGLCVLHELKLKPSEGRKAIHSNTDGGLKASVLESWKTAEGEQLLKEFEFYDPLVPKLAKTAEAAMEVMKEADPHLTRLLFLILNQEEK